MKKGLKQKLQSIETSTCFMFQQINDEACELLIDRQGYAGTYSIDYARRVCKELGKNWSNIFKKW